MKLGDAIRTMELQPIPLTEDEEKSHPGGIKMKAGIRIETKVLLGIPEARKDIEDRLRRQLFAAVFGDSVPAVKVIAGVLAQYQFTLRCYMKPEDMRMLEDAVKALAQQVTFDTLPKANGA